MQFLRDLLDKAAPHVQKGGRFQALGAAFQRFALPIQRVSDVQGADAEQKQDNNQGF